MNWHNRKQFRIGLPATTKNWLTLFGRANWKRHFKLQLNSNSLNSQLIWSALVVVKALNDLNNWTLWWARSDGGAKLWHRWINWPSGDYVARAVCDKGASLSLSLSLLLSHVILYFRRKCGNKKWGKRTYTAVCTQKKCSPNPLTIGL